MQNVGQEEFDYNTFKMTYDSDPVVQALTKRFDQNGIELNSKKAKADVAQTDGSDSGTTVSQMAKRSTARNLG